MKMKKISLYLRLSLTIGIFAFLFWKLGFKNIVNTIGSADLRWVAAIGAMFPLLLAISILNYKILLKPFRVNVSFWRLAYRYVQSSFLGFALPSKLGELSLVYLLGREKVPLGLSAAVVVINKGMIVVAAAAFALVGIPLFLRGFEAYAIAGLVFAAALSGSLLLTSGGRKLIRRMLPKWATTKMTGFGESLLLLIFKKPKYVLSTLALSILNNALTALLLVIAFAALGTPVGLLETMIIISTSLIVSLIPITPGGFGLREGTAVVLFGRIGIEGSRTLAANFIVVATTYLLMGFLLGILEIFVHRNEL